jgi:hypothetical protein
MADLQATRRTGLALHRLHSRLELTLLLIAAGDEPIRGRLKPHSLLGDQKAVGYDKQGVVN